MNSNQKTEAYEKIKAELVALTTSPLYTYRVENSYQPVMGAGDLSAKFLFVGEAPGKNEALAGRPFCGRAGQILENLLSGVGMKREDVYVTNIVKDRPPENRDPLPAELALYAPFLEQELSLVQPEVVVTLGRFSMEYIMQKYGLEDNLDSISKIHGQILQARNFKLIPLYHPAATIYNRKLLPELEKDFRTLPTL